MRLLLVLTLALFYQSCTTVSNTNVEKSQLRMQLGLSHLERQNFPLALKELLTAEELNPKDPYIQNNLGLVYYLREKHPEAIQHFSKAFELNPKYTDAKNNLARVYIEIGQLDIAQTLLNEVLADLTYTGGAKAQLNYGLLEFNRHQYKKAITRFRTVLITRREDCSANAYLGRSYLELKQYKTANDQLEKANDICKQFKSDEGLYYWAISLYRSGEKPQALLRFKELHSFYPQGKFHDQSKKMIDLIEKGNL